MYAVGKDTVSGIIPLCSMLGEFDGRWKKNQPTIRYEVAWAVCILGRDKIHIYESITS